MRKKDINPGDIILVPLDNDKCAIAKIIFISIRYKNVILLSFYPLIINCSDSYEVPSEISHQQLIYTGITPIQKEEWKKIGTCFIGEEERQLSKRIIGGALWVEDEFIRNTTEDDLKTFKNMEVYGTALVKTTIVKYLTSKKLL